MKSLIKYFLLIMCSVSMGYASVDYYQAEKIKSALISTATIENQTIKEKEQKNLMNQISKLNLETQEYINDLMPEIENEISMKEAEIRNQDLADVQKTAHKYSIKAFGSSYENLQKKVGK